MRILLIFILILANNALFAQVLDIDNTYKSSLYFSIGTTINWRYYNVTESNFRHSLKDYCIFKMKQINHNIYHPFTTNFPDSIRLNTLKIDTNYYALKLDNKENKLFKINSFNLKCGYEASGKTWIRFDVPNNIKFNWNDGWQDLFILSENPDELKQIELINPKQISNIAIREKIIVLLSQFLTTNIDIFEQQITYLYLKDNNLALKDLLVNFENIFKLDFLSLNENNVLVLGEFIGSRPYRFLALINLENENVDFHQHRILNSIFNFEKELFIFSKSYGPNTGANCYNVDIVGKDGLKPIFRDGSFSM